MIEKFIRLSFPILQSTYDRMPYTLQNIFTTVRGYPLARARYQKLFWEHLEELLNREKFTPSEMEAYQNERLNNLIKFIHENVPFYRKYFSEQRLHISDIKSINDLPKLPVLTREMVRKHFKSLVASAIPYNQQIQVFTSGTCGAGLPVYYDKVTLAKNWAFRTRQKIWANINPREWRITLFGSKIVPLQKKRPPFWTYNYFEKQVLMSIFHLSKANEKFYIDFLQSHQNFQLEGFPTVLYTLSDFILQENLSIPMKAIFTDGEPLYSYIRGKIESAFATKVYDHYGMTEMVGLIQECENGNYHLISDYGILEILDDQQNPVSDGQEGYMVWTGLINLTMPLIRYKIGDKGMWQANQCCSCGRPYPLVHPTITRDSDYLIAPDGRILSPRAINQLLKNKTSFNACQFIQHKCDKFTIRIVPGNSNAKAEACDVRRGLYNILSKNIVIEIVESEKPIQYENGKTPLIISNLGKKHEEKMAHC